MARNQYSRIITYNGAVRGVPFWPSCRNIHVSRKRCQPRRGYGPKRVPGLYLHGIPCSACRTAGSRLAEQPWTNHGWPGPPARIGRGCRCVVAVRSTSGRRREGRGDCAGVRGGWNPLRRRWNACVSQATAEEVHAQYGNCKPDHERRTELGDDSGAFAGAHPVEEGARNAITRVSTHQATIAVPVTLAANPANRSKEKF